MSFDVAISLDEGTLNRIVAVLYARPGLRNGLFTGSRTATVLSEQVTVGWDVQAVPVVQLVPPTPEQWTAAVKGDGSTAPIPSTNAFLISFPRLSVTRTLPGGTVQQATVPVEAICTVGLRNNQLVLDAEAAVVDLSQAPAFDRAFVYPVLIPEVLNMADSLVSGQQVPALSFGGLTFGDAALAVGGSRLVAVANLQGSPAPDAPDPASLPAGEFYVLLSSSAMTQVAAQGAAGLQGKQGAASGSQGFGIGTASYQASATLTRVSATPTPDLTAVSAQVSVEVSASAGVDVLGTIVNGIVQAGETVGNAFEDAGKAVAHAFSSY